MADIDSGESQCSRLSDYDVRVEDEKGGGRAGVRTQAIIGDKLFVWFKDSTDIAFYEASARISDFLEKGDEALTVKLSNIGGGDATAISQALSFDFRGFIETADVVVERIQDSDDLTRIRLVFARELSSVVDLPRVSILDRRMVKRFQPRPIHLTRVDFRSSSVFRDLWYRKITSTR